MDISEAKHTVTDRNGFAWFKYVRIGNEFRFLEMEQNHSDCLNDNEIAKSAGTVKIRFGEIEVSDYSMTLNIGPAEDDEKIITELFKPDQT
jgi:hypothetical protein